MSTPDDCFVFEIMDEVWEGVEWQNKAALFEKPATNVHKLVVGRLREALTRHNKAGRNIIAPDKKLLDRLEMIANGPENRARTAITAMACAEVIAAHIMAVKDPRMIRGCFVSLASYM